MTVLGTTTAGYYRHTVEIVTWREIAAELLEPILDRTRTVLETATVKLRGARRETYIHWNRLAA